MRSSWNAVPDRGGHAYNTNPQPAAQPATNVGRQIAREDVPVGPIQGTERYYTVVAGDRLYQIARRHGASLYWIIKRNDLSDLPYSGQKLIVPGPALR
jgi:LysM repeat protein